MNREASESCAARGWRAAFVSHRAARDPGTGFSLWRMPFLTALLFMTMPAVAGAQAAPPPVDGDSAAGASLRVFLMTIGQGDYIFERFGHNAIWIRDEKTGRDVAWNYGIFDFEQPGYIGRLVRGDMRYWVESYDANVLARHYQDSNRTVMVQELNLTPSRKAGLRDFLEWNEQEEHRYYRYDYYRDNCSTRVRDALDRAVDGQLRHTLEAIPTETTYRSHTQRLLVDRIPAATGTLLGLGPATDVPLDAWETAFLPVQFMQQIRDLRVSRPDGSVVPLVLGGSTVFQADRAPEATLAPDRLLFYLATGIALGGLAWLLGRGEGSGRVAIAFAVFGGVIMLAIGIFGSIIAYLWLFTDHSFTYRNENVLQANPFALVAGGLLLLGTFGRARAAARVAVLVVAALAVLGFVLQVLPGIDQSNGSIIGLLLPFHLGMALGVVSDERDRRL
ncbi:MAG: DUF4105 domain-containing protein [Longimicrobiales bacterium]